MVASLLLLASLALGSALVAPAEEPRSLQMSIAPYQGMAPTSLPLGTPRSFMLSQGALSFYTFTVPTPFLGFHVSLTNAYGNSNLYLSLQPPTASGWVTPNATYSDYVSTSMLSAESVNVYPTDRVVRQSGCTRGYAGSSCTFVVGVSASTSSLIWLTGYLDGSIRALPAGLPIVDFIYPYRYVYYSYTVPSPTFSLSLALTPISGVPSMYLSVSNFTSAVSVAPMGGVGGSTPTVPVALVPATFCDQAAPPVSDGSYPPLSYGLITYAPALPGSRCPPCTTYPCTLIIAVGAPDYAFYSLAASENGLATPAGIVALLDGMPHRSESRAVSAAPQTQSNRTQLYDFTFVPANVGPASPSVVTVELGQYAGDAPVTLGARWVVNGGWGQAPDLASVGSGGGVGGNAPPALYTATSVAGAATLSIPRLDPYFIQACGGTSTSSSPCTLRVAVVSSPPTSLPSSTYTLTARTDMGLQLMEGTPAMGEVPTSPGALTAGTGYVFFRFNHINPLTFVTFTVTGLNGPVDLFLSSSLSPPAQQPPTATAYALASLSTSTSLGSTPRSLTLSPTDAASCAPPCKYYLGVRAGVGATEGVLSFTLTGRTRAASASTLYDGRPVADVVEPGGVAYFTIPLSVTTPSLTLSLTPTTPGVPLAAFITVDGSLPSPTNAPWSLGGDFATATPRPDGLYTFTGYPGLTSPGTESQVVLSRSHPLLLAACTQSITTTKTAQVCQDFGGTDPICLPVTTTTTTPGSATACTIKVAVTTAVFPSPTRGAATTPLALPPTNSTPGSFLITAASGLSPRLLLDGVPATITVAPGVPTPLVFEAAAGSTHVTLSITPQFSRVTAYVSARGPNPGPATAATNLATFAGISSYTLPLSTGPATCAPTSPRCAFYASLVGYSVFGEAASAAVHASVTVVAASLEISDLAPGIARTAYAEADHLTLFSFTVPAAAAGVGMEVVCETLRGGGWLTLVASSTVNPATGVVIPPTLQALASGSPTLTTTYGSASTASMQFLPGLVGGAGGGTTSLNFDSNSSITTSSSPSQVFAPGVTYIVGVAGGSSGSGSGSGRAPPPPTEFLITLRPLGTPLPLTNGVYIHGTLTTPTSSALYTLTIPMGSTPRTLQVVGLSLSGFFTLYLANASNPSPGPTAYDRMGTYASNYFLPLPPTYIASACPSLALSHCTLYLAVRPADPTATLFPIAFGLTASLSSSSIVPTLVLPGAPQLVTIPGGSWDYFYAPLDDATYGSALAALASPPAVAVQDVVGPGVAMYANVNGVFPTSTNPSLVSFYTDSLSNPKSFLIPPGSGSGGSGSGSGSGSGASPRILAIGVYAKPGPPTSFYLSLSTPTSITDLPDGAPIQGVTAAGSYTYYSLTLPGGTSATISKTKFSGNSDTLASLWYTGRTPPSPALASQRITLGNRTWMSTFEGVLTIPSAPPLGCAGPCVLQLAVYCQSTFSCAYALLASVDTTSLARLYDGVPTAGFVAPLPGSPSSNATAYRRYSYQYSNPAPANITLSAVSVAGSTRTFVSRTWSPGFSPLAALPALEDPSTFSLASTTDYTKACPTCITLVHPGGPGVSTFTIAVRGDLSRPASYQIVALPPGTPTVLSPGVFSMGHALGMGGSDRYVFDSQDVGNDLIIQVTALTGVVTLTSVLSYSATPLYSFPGCTVRPPAQGASVANPGTATCPGAQWRADSTITNTQAQIRIAAAGPCSRAFTPTAIPNTNCTWRAGAMNLVVTALTPGTQYYIGITSSQDPLRAMDGYPLDFSQLAGAAPTVLSFSTIPTPTLSEVRVTFSADTSSASFRYAFTSCSGALCTPALENPVWPPSASPAPTTTAWGYVDAGDDITVILGASSPAACSGNGYAGDVCNYFLTLWPDTAYCAGPGARLVGPTCAAHADITFASSTGSAPLRISYPQIRNRAITLKGALRPEPQGLVPSPNLYNLYINLAGSAPTDLVDVSLRLDACDVLRGHAQAWVCLSDPTSTSLPDGRDEAYSCLSPAQPSPPDAYLTLDTTSTGFEGVKLLQEPSNNVYIAVGTAQYRNYPNRTGASEAAMAKWGAGGASTYELVVIDGAPVVIAPPLVDNPLLVARLTQSSAQVTWATPQALQFGYSGALAGLNITALGLTYTLYLAKGSFTGVAMAALNDTAANLGILPTTACGLERWAALTNYTPPVFNASVSSYRLTGLVPATMYRLVVVVSCDHSCLVANSVALGLGVPTGSQSPQRFTLAPMYFTLDADPPHPPMVFLSTAEYTLGVLATLGVGAGALFLCFHKKPVSEAKGGSAEGAQVSKGPGGRSIVAVPNSYFFASRSIEGLSAEAGVVAAGGGGGGAPRGVVVKVVGGAGGGGGGSGGEGGASRELEELAKVTERVFQRGGSGGGSGSGDSGLDDPSSVDTNVVVAPTTPQGGWK